VQSIHSDVPIPIVRTVQWSPDGALRIVDQRLLPAEYVERDLRTVPEVAEAIRTLAVRGAPAIGVAAAMGLAAAVRHASRSESGHAAIADVAAVRAFVHSAAAELRATRPTAVNLGWALDRMRAVLDRDPGVGVTPLTAALRAEAEAIRAEDEAMCAAIGAAGRELLRDGMRVLTHCNAGALATAGIGTALAPVYAAVEAGLRVEVFADETRPLLQGARLTAWELARAGVPVTVITDGMAGSLMAAGKIDLVLVGADRIAANGDSANKIGTYSLAVLAKHHRIPFVVVAPSSSIDARTPTGAEIPIEQRAPDEVTHLAGARVAAAGATVFNPAFDVTPAALISHIVTEAGVLCAPFHFDHTPITLPPA
jgi:methylthioribose-1-phosphate isomerase